MFDGSCDIDTREVVTYVDNMEDILMINMKELSIDDIMSFSFANVRIAFSFYNWYANLNGFGARKSNVLKNKDGEIVQQTFVCFREGYRQDRGLTCDMRKREPKVLTRCGCEAKFRVHVEKESNRWHVTYFMDEHNHVLFDEKFTSMLPAHRRMQDGDIMQMNNMRKVGISTPLIYGSFASQSGGYEKIGFRMKDMYNVLTKQKLVQGTDVRGVIEYFRSMCGKDSFMVWKHTVDVKGRLEHLFWCDGVSQMNFQLFGDVLAFDATYKKNKYMLPFVVFSGVNHHNETTIFGSAIIGNEKEETYVWLLEQFKEAMKGKEPSSIITDGDIAMRNAIKMVFPGAHHRLCAWHLTRNATSNIGIPEFTAAFANCMLGDYEVGEFERKWKDMVEKFGVAEHRWILEMYEKRKMWATAHVRGNFFAGFRTTSRCEGFHSQIGKYVHSRLNLTEFVQHYQRCLDYMRYKEVESDFASGVGEPVLQTSYEELERSAASHFTREIFLLFRPVLMRACRVNVSGSKQTASHHIYIVSKYRREGQQWHVSFNPQTFQLTCSCMRMESFGLPCEHIVAVLVYRNIDELPKCLLLQRWSKEAKELAECNFGDGSNYWDCNLIGKFHVLLERCRLMCTYAYVNKEDWTEANELVTSRMVKYKANRVQEASTGNATRMEEDENVQDPVRVRTKGKPRTSQQGGTRRRRTVRCGHCKESGHNRQTCPKLKEGENPDDGIGESPI